MLTIKVLGSGCKKCSDLAQRIEEVVQEAGLDASGVKETSSEAIMNYGVMRTPAIVIDEQLVHSGALLSKEEIAALLPSS